MDTKTDNQCNPRMMRRKRQKLSEEKCLEIIDSASHGVLSLSDEYGIPYGVPLNFVFDSKQNALYFHSAVEGHKIDAIRNNHNASFCIIDKDRIVAEEFTSYFRSVILSGKIDIASDRNEVLHSLRMLSEKYSPGIDPAKEIEKCIDHVCILRFQITCISGKEAIELVAKKNSDKNRPDTALLVIDMQNEFVDPRGKLSVKGAASTIPAIENAITFARNSKWPVIHAIRNHDRSGNDVEISRKKFFDGENGICIPDTWGCGITDRLKPELTDIIVVKKRFSAFFGTQLDEILQEMGIKRLIICGTQYPNCIRATAVDAMSLDYSVVVCTDACSAQSEEISQANIADMRNMGIECIGMDSILGNGDQ